ncbi:MAG: DUF4870 domain-containing protein [Microbacterium sp.]
MATPPNQPPVPPQPPYAAAQPVPPMSPADEKMWATLVHVGGIVLGVLSPLVGYLVLRDRGPFVRQHTAAALNFQLTILIADLVGALLVFVGVGVLLIFAISVVALVFSIIAAVKANRGEWYTYPLSIRFVS